MQKNKWKVCKMGGPSTGGWELSVIRESNKHGRESYGWFDKNKLLISETNWGTNHPKYKQIWKKLLKVAEEIAAELNGEQQ